MEDNKYYLVLEKRRGDYNIIDINKLDICSFAVSNDIASIDSFTLLYSESEIKSSIGRSNMASSIDYLDGELRIISDLRHNLDIISKNVYLEISEFINSQQELDRDFKNKIYGSYKKVVEKTFKDKDFLRKLLDDFKIVLRSGNKKEVFKKIEELPYERSRLIYLKVYQEVINKKDINLRKLEKLSDVA